MLLAIVLTLVAFLDYSWDSLPAAYKKRKGLKVAIVLSLLVFGWVQAAIQYNRDKQSDKDIEYLKRQSSKPSFQLFRNTFDDKYITNRIETNLLTGATTTHVGINRVPGIAGLSAGETIDLNDSREIALS